MNYPLLTTLLWLLASAITLTGRAQDAELPALIQSTLNNAGDNRDELEQALAQIEPAYREGMEFLLAYMPPSDAATLQSQFLLENVRQAYLAWESAPWHDQVGKQLFFNYILPYANVSERRDNWRVDFRSRFSDLIADAESISAAAVRLNQKVFPQVGVTYSARRYRADQGPLESIERGTASCTGLSILLIDACRANGIPARFVGTPRWSDNSGNHSWVEIWDGDWHFTGACEPAGDDLNKAWFTDRAANADPDQPMHAIYAVSYRRTPLKFPLVWRRNFDPVWAINVTDRYVLGDSTLAPGQVMARFRVLHPKSNQRLRLSMQILDPSGDVLHQGKTKHEGYDTNDHLKFPLNRDTTYSVRMQVGGQTHTTAITTGKDSQLYSLELPQTLADGLSESPGPEGEPDSHPPVSGSQGTPQTPSAANSTSSLSDDGDRALQALQAYLASQESFDATIADQPFAHQSLSASQARLAADLLWKHLTRTTRAERQSEIDNQLLTLDELEMKFDFKTFGERPEPGHALFISLHGGGNAPARVNEQQWRNQVRLYEPEEGIYLAPRAPTDTWNLWHQAHIDPFFDRLIEDFVVTGQVDPQRVYLLGYSAGGDGVFQLAPRMADRLAAACMMAGHPNETRPAGLRNLPFAIFMGGQDAAYDRNQKAADWKVMLSKLKAQDPGGYDHQVHIFPEKGHWMDKQDAVGIAWMAEKTRNFWPEKIVWLQDDVTHQRFYWLGTDADGAVARQQVEASVDGQIVSLHSEQPLTGTWRLYLHDRLVNLDQPLTIEYAGQTLKQTPQRNIAAIVHSLLEYADPETIATAILDLPAPANGD